MRYNNNILSQHHHTLLASVTWLERFEEQIQNGGDHYPLASPLPTCLNSTMIGLKTALITLQHQLNAPQGPLFKLLESTGQTPLLQKLQPQRHRLNAQAQQLLEVLAEIHARVNGAPCHQDLHTHLQERWAEECWDDSATLINALSEQLINYLYLAETSYLSMTDSLLNPASTPASNSRTAPQRATESVSIDMLAHASQPFSAQYHSS